MLEQHEKYTVYIGTGENYPDAEKARRILARFGTPKDALGYWEGEREKTFILDVDAPKLSAITIVAFSVIKQDAILIERDSVGWLVFKDGSIERVGGKRVYFDPPNTKAWTYVDGRYIVFGR